MEQINAKEIQERFEQEVYWCQLTYQMLDECIFDPDRKYMLEPARESFNRLYMILVDYLCMRLIRLFDSADQKNHKNFSLKRIAQDIEAIQNDGGEAFEKISHYRKKHLAHCDLHTSSSSLLPYNELKAAAEALLIILHDNLDVIRKHNGQDTERVRYIPSHHQSDFIQLLAFGSFLHSKWHDPNYRDIIHECTTWHAAKRSDLAD